MAGELWQGIVQAGVETDYGVEVAATRILYARDPVFTRVRDPRIHKFMTASRDNVRNISLGPEQVGGTLTMPVSAEILELLLMGLKGAVSPSSGTSTEWTFTFTPGTSLNSATLEWHDGAREWTITGAYANSLKIAGSVSGENLLTAEIFAKAMAIKAKTGSLTHGVPAVFEGWETAFYLDAAGTALSTAKTGLLLSWDITIANGLARKYTAANTLTPSAITMSELEVTATLVVEASAAQAATEYANWDAATSRVVGLVFGGNAQIGATGSYETVSLAIPGKWTALDLGQTNENTRAYQLSCNYVYDAALAYGVSVAVLTARSAAWADRT